MAVQRCVPEESWGVAVAMNVSEGTHSPQRRYLTFACYISTTYIILNPLVESSLISLFHIVSEWI